MNWCLYAAVIIAFPLQLKFREEYRRLAVDKGRVITPVSIEVSTEVEQSGDSSIVRPTV